MGYYINENSKGEPLLPHNKAKQLIADGAVKIEPKEFHENLVCVISNRPFDAAGFAFNEKEMQEFMRADGRNKIWLIYKHAKELSGYSE